MSNLIMQDQLLENRGFINFLRILLLSDSINENTPAYGITKMIIDDRKDILSEQQLKTLHSTSSVCL